MKHSNTNEVDVELMSNVGQIRHVIIIIIIIIVVVVVVVNIDDDHHQSLRMDM